MTTENKPSRNEEEYFARLEAERIERKRQEQSRLNQDAERKSHYMRCPKCGGKLVTEEMNRLHVDRCPDCHGVWFDHGELEALTHASERGFISRTLGDFMGSLRRKN